MLMSPPAPPKPSITSESAVASIIGFRHGSTFSHPTRRGAAQTAGDLGRCADREDCKQGRHRDQPGKHRMHELESGADLRVREQMMRADRHRHHDKQDEGNPSIASLYSRPPIARGKMA